MTEARETFASRSDRYAADRPRYPAALFEWIAAKCRSRDAAWDCATGSGQAAVDLADRFNRVYASDVSPEQVKHAIRRANIYYSVQPAERTDYAGESFDLVSVAQALHWFNLESFWDEVRRVGKHGSFFCAWGYAWFDAERPVDAGLVAPFRNAIAPFWAVNNRLLWDDYRDEAVRFPFERIKAPRFAIELDWSLGQLVAYMETWSATKRAREDAGICRRLDDITTTALESLGAESRLHISMPLTILAGRIEK